MTRHTELKSQKVSLISLKKIIANSAGFVCAMIFLATSLVLSGCAIQSVRSRPVNNQAKLGPEIRDVVSDSTDVRDSVPRRRVMVLPFLDASGKSSKAAPVARSAFMGAMKASDDFVFIDTKDFPSDINNYLKNNEYELGSMGKAGSAMGLSIIIEGRILEIKAKRLSEEIGIVRQVQARLDATVQLRIVSAKSGHILMNETRSASIEDATTRVGQRVSTDRELENDPGLIEAAIIKAFQSTVPKIAQAVDKLSWEGRVAAVKADRVFLNAGRISGLQIGEILKVTDGGEDVYDPETGSMVGKVPGRLKGTVEVVSYFGKDGAIAVIHSGSGFRENDLVEVY
jgi:hypothetical protein